MKYIFFFLAYANIIAPFGGRENAKSIKNKNKVRKASGTSGCMKLRAPDIEMMTCQGWSSRCRQSGTPPCVAHSWGRDGAAAPRRGD